MADGLQGFLVNLATDPAKLGEFIRDPDAAMEAAQLGDEDRAALRSGNPAAIYGRLSGQTGAPAGAAPPTTVVVVDLAAAGEQNIPVIRQPQAGIVYAAPPLPVYGPAPGADIVYAAASPQPVYAAPPLPVYGSLPVYAPHAAIVYTAAPQPVYAAPQPLYPAPHAGIVYAAHPQAGIVYAAHPQAGIVYAASAPAGQPVYAVPPGTPLPVYGR